jgi:hypothetical protein
VVDSLNNPETPQSVPEVEATESAKGPAGFLGSTVGKLVIGGVALVLVLGAIGAILMLFVFNDTSSDEGSTASVPAPSADASATTQTAPAQEESPTVRPADEWADTFVFRNVFQPTIKVTLAPLPDTDEDNGEDPAADVPADTLYLDSVETVDGVPTANLIWNGTTYSLEEGESIPDTPWKVVSIEGDTVVMLYGDARVTLTVGQGLSK